MEGIGICILRLAGYICIALIAHISIWERIQVSRTSGHSDGRLSIRHKPPLVLLSPNAFLYQCFSLAAPFYVLYMVLPVRFSPDTVVVTATISFQHTYPQIQDSSNAFPFLAKFST